MNTSSFSILLLFSGLRRLFTRHKLFQRATARHSYPSSPAIGNEGIALLKDDDDESSTLPIIPSRNHGLANDVRIESSQIQNFHYKDAKRKFDVRETARLGFEFGVLWVIRLLLRRRPKQADYARSSSCVWASDHLGYYSDSDVRQTILLQPV